MSNRTTTNTTIHHEGEVLGLKKFKSSKGSNIQVQLLYYQCITYESAQVTFKKTMVFRFSGQAKV